MFLHRFFTPIFQHRWMLDQFTFFKRVTRAYLSNQIRPHPKISLICKTCIFPLFWRIFLRGCIDEICNILQPWSRTSLHQRSDGNVIPDQTFYQQNLSFQKKSLNLFKEMQYFDNSSERNILISFPWKNLGFSFCSHFCCFPSKVLELLFFGNCTKWVSEKMFWNPSRTYLYSTFPA